MADDAISHVFSISAKRHAEKPHLSGGLSQHGACEGKQLLDSWFPTPFDDVSQGNMAPGTLGHQFVQDAIPSGTLIAKRWLVIGHEQYVFYNVGGKLRKSPIDTLATDTKENRFEIWDYKFTRKDMKYIHEPDFTYRAQLNTYAGLLHQRNRLENPPVCRLMYFNKSNYSDCKEFAWELDADLFADSLKSIERVESYKSKYNAKTWTKIPIDEWGLLITRGLTEWSTTKTPYLLNCKYCANPDKCKKMRGE